MLPKENRLTQKTDFENVRQSGKFVSTPIFTFSYTEQPNSSAGEARFGFIVSKKISTKAHIRNRVKRILREIVRNNISAKMSGYDCVIIAKPGIVHATHATIETQVKNVIKNL